MTQKFRMRCWRGLTKVQRIGVSSLARRPWPTLRSGFTPHSHRWATVGRLGRANVKSVVTPQGTTTMKALVQEGDGSADVLHVREISRPALAAGRVLVKVRAASVNALDWHSVHGGTMLRIASKVMRSKSEPVRGVDVAGYVGAVG